MINEKEKNKVKKEKKQKQTADGKQEKKLLIKAKKIFEQKNINKKKYEKEKNERKNVLDKWGDYRTKIREQKLGLDQYTNCIGHFKVDKDNKPIEIKKSSNDEKPQYEKYDGEYLCHFLETESKVWGSSRGGNNYQYMVVKKKDYDEKDKKIIYKYIINNDDKILRNRDDAEKVYDKLIKPLLEKLVEKNFDFKKNEKNEKNEKNYIESILEEFKITIPSEEYDLYKAVINEKLKNIDLSLYDIYKFYPAKQVLDKIIVLRSFDDNDGKNENFKYKLMPVYKDDFYDWAWVDLLNEDIKEIKGKHTIEKNYKVTTKLLENIDKEEIKNPTEDDIFAIYECVYGLYQNKDFLGNEPNVIFHGAPGTGKTYAINEGLRKLGIDDDHICKIQCHLNYNYEDFIEGIKPVGITDQGQVKLETISGQFKNFCIKAKKDLQNIEADDYYFICDEINRTNVSEMFGETLVMIEKDYRDDINSDNRIELLNSTPLANVIKAKIEELYNNKDKDKLKEYINKNVYELSYRISGKNKYYGDKDNSDKDRIEKMIEEWDSEKDKAELFNEMKVLFGIPKNIRFIGMMNDVDKSIDSFDLALRRRFKWIRKDFDKDVLYDELYEFEESDSYIDSCVELNTYISKELMLGKSYEFGHSYFLKIKGNSKNKKISKKNKEELFEQYLEPILKEYLRSFYDENEIDGKIKTARSKFLQSKEDTNQENENTSSEE